MQQQDPNVRMSEETASLVGHLTLDNQHLRIQAEFLSAQLMDAQERLADALKEVERLTPGPEVVPPVVDEAPQEHVAFREPLRPSMSHTQGAS